MLRSITKEILTKKTYRFEDALKPGIINVFIKTNCDNENYLGWVTLTSSAYWIDPEVVEAAREFLKGKDENL